VVGNVEIQLHESGVVKKPSRLRSGLPGELLMVAEQVDRGMGNRSADL